MYNQKRTRAAPHQPPSLKSNRQTHRQRRVALTCVLVLSLCTTSSPGYLQDRLPVSMPRAPVPEFSKFVTIFARLEAEELGSCFSIAGFPRALFRFSSNRLQVLDFSSNFGAFTRGAQWGWWF